MRCHIEFCASQLIHVSSFVSTGKSGFGLSGSVESDRELILNHFAAGGSFCQHDLMIKS